MSPDRVEPFQLALKDLRTRLQDGRLRPGVRINAKDTADTLGLSPTPVREALWRLTGEGAVEERRGEGFFARTWAAVEIADLYRLHLAVLATAQGGERLRRDLSRVSALAASDDPLSLTDRLFATWVAEASSRVLLDDHRVLSLRLSSVRRLEPQLLHDLPREAERLLSLSSPHHQAARGAALVAFHERRIVLAEPFAELLAREPLA